MVCSGFFPRWLLVLSVSDHGDDVEMLLGEGRLVHPIVRVRPGSETQSFVTLMVTETDAGSAVEAGKLGVERVLGRPANVQSVIEVS